MERRTQMSKNKDLKQFPLSNKQNCIVYLYKIITSSELCMDTFKEYNKETKYILDKYKDHSLIPANIYQDVCHKTYDVMSYLLNLLGDAQTSSISYFKYRNQIQKRIKKGLTDIPINDLNDEVNALIAEFNKARNWLNHIPESLLVAEMDLINQGKADISFDPVTIIHHNYATLEYFEHLYLSNIEFCQQARKIIQAAKKDYALLMGKSITYRRIYTDKPFDISRAEAAKKSAKIQGLSSKEIDIL